MKRATEGPPSAKAKSARTAATEKKQPSTVRYYIRVLKPQGEKEEADARDECYDPIWLSEDRLLSGNPTLRDDANTNRNPDRI